jgi:hypothetical protein
MRCNNSPLASNNSQVLPNPVCTSTRAVPSTTVQIQAPLQGVRSHRMCGYTHYARIHPTVGLESNSDHGK